MEARAGGGSQGRLGSLPEADGCSACACGPYPFRASATRSPRRLRIIVEGRLEDVLASKDFDIPVRLEAAKVIMLAKQVRILEEIRDLARPSPEALERAFEAGQEDQAEARDDPEPEE